MSEEQDIIKGLPACRYCGGKPILKKNKTYERPWTFEERMKWFENNKDKNEVPVGGIVDEAEIQCSRCKRTIKAVTITDKAAAFIAAEGWRKAMEITEEEAETEKSEDKYPVPPYPWDDRKLPGGKTWFDYYGIDPKKLGYPVYEWNQKDYMPKKWELLHPDCSFCIHEEVCKLWYGAESQDACGPGDGSCFTPKKDWKKIEHAHWICKKEGCLEYAPKCSKCGYEDEHYTHSKYCHECGALMDEEVNDGEGNL